MRTASEFRERQLEMLPRSLQRPGFFCGNQGDLFYGTILRDLIWLDDRPKSDTLHAMKLLQGSLRVFGQFFYQNHQHPDQYENEVASTYAQAAFRLGYYTPARLLTRTEYNDINRALDADFFSSDHNLSEIQSQFGKPSHDVLGGQTTVHCYACEDVDCEWMFFDYSRCYPPEDGVTYNWFDEPLLRDVRRLDNKFELLPFSGWFQRLEPENKDG